MLKKTISYTDLKGDTVTEDHYFHLSKADLIELEVSGPGNSYKEFLEKIVAAEDGKEIMAAMKNLIMVSYGMRSEDGRRFIKTQTLRDDFASSEAYSELFTELCTNAEAAAEFANGLMPTNLQTIEKKELDGDVKNVFDNPREAASPAAGSQVITKAEAVEMDANELQKLLANGATLVDNVE